jgi:predicted transcriptional regulator
MVDARNAMATALPKDEVRRLLDRLPDEASYEDIHYHMYVQQKIDRGLEAAEQGDFISDEEIERRITRWSGE